MKYSALDRMNVSTCVLHCCPVNHLFSCPGGVILGKHNGFLLFFHWEQLNTDAWNSFNVNLQGRGTGASYTQTGGGGADPTEAHEPADERSVPV